MPEPKEVGGGRHEDQGFKSAEQYASFEVGEDKAYEFPRKIKRSDIKPHAIEAGETEIVFQRHGSYIRDREDARVGSLSEESADAERQAAEAYFRAFLDQLPADERSSVEILVLASDTQYFDGGKRSYETAEIAQESAKSVLGEFALSEDQIINSSGRLAGDGAPRPMPKLREPNFLNDSPDFLDFMLNKYGGVNLDFWVAFEEDRHKDVREQMGAEGPDDIADRMGFTLRVLARYSKAFHKSNPDKRLIIWGATHYDTISPFVKRDVFGVGKEEQLLVDYGAGITIDLDKEGNGSTEIAGRLYPVETKRPAV